VQPFFGVSLHSPSDFRNVRKQSPNPNITNASSPE
jgi:hypothetical protein